jgi:glycosyltransferase involved in cell wall biosynthesis
MIKHNLIFIAPLPPPFGGISVIAKSLFEAGLSEKFNLIHLNTSKNSPTEKIGKITLQDVLLALRNYYNLTLICLKNRNYKSAFLVGTCDTGIIRDFGYIFILKLFRIKLILNLHGTRNISKKNMLISYLTKKSIKHAFCVLSPTKVDMKEALNVSKDKTNIKLFYNSTFVKSKYINLNKCKENNELRIIGIGRISEAKGTYDLINVCADLISEDYNISLTWIGKGAYKQDEENVDRIISASKEVKNRICFHSDISEDEKFQLLNSSHIFILPTYADNLPIAILEAMAVGLPVISTRVGAIPEVIDNQKNGWLIEPGDKTELKKIITYAYNRKNSFEEMRGSNKTLFAQSFSSYQRLKELASYASLQSIS